MCIKELFDMKKKFNVTGMHCASCQAAVERCTRKLNGVSAADVNLINGTMTVDFDENVIAPADICAAVEDAGFGAEEADDEPRRQNSEAAGIGRRFLCSLFFLIPLLYITTIHMLGAPLPSFLDGRINGIIQLALSLAIIVINNTFFVTGTRTLFHGSPNMDTLVAFGSAVSFIFSVYSLITGGPSLYFESSAMILTLITLGKYLEARSKRKTGNALESLENMAPKTAIAIRDGYEIVLPVSRLRQGEIIVLKPGMSAPADGVVTEGTSYLDQSVVTGESEYVFKQPGDEIISASINHTGSLKFRATRVGEETSFSKIVKLVSEASSSKAPIQRLADRIAGIFVPVVMALALITFAVWMIVEGNFEQALTHAVSVLVISCPCSLGLAAPVAVMAGTGRGAQLSILYGSAEILERTGKISHVALDKTGTVTFGRPEVTDVISYGDTDFAGPAAALENLSEHPIACAVCNYAGTGSTYEVTGFESITGKGIKGTVNGTVYHIGNESMAEHCNADLSGCAADADRLKNEGKTVVYVCAGEKVEGLYAVADRIRPTSADAVIELKGMGIDVTMLTGDNGKTADVIAAAAGIENVRANLLPEDKQDILREIKESGGFTAMVGDGVNDAPSLATADIGISVGAGTDIAIQSSDIVLLRDDLKDLPTAIRLSRAVVRNIKENFFWALFYNALCIPLAAGVYTSLLGWEVSPVYAAAAMSVSSLFVVGNSLRLMLFGKSKKSVKPVD